MNWDKYDLLSLEGIAVEVKSSGNLQSWDQDKLSSLEFGIQPTHGWDSSSNTYSNEPARQSDIYVFCVHKHTEQDTVNPLDISQWDFYLLLTKTLNEKAGVQKTAQLSSLLKMGAEKCEYGRLHQRIVELVKR
mgnify:FL=1